MTIVDAVAVDGRSARRERNRREIVDALLELIREGTIDASAAEVAARAGLSERSLFRYFDDVNDLYGEVCAVQFSRLQPRAAIDGFARGTTDDKVTAFIEQRITLHQAIGRVGVAARAHAHRNPVIAKQLIDARALLRKQIAEHFATELKSQDDARRRAAVASIDLCTTYEALEMLLTEHRMTYTAVRDVLTIIIRKALQ
jgi:AcrR family transcriptional regulator